MCRVQVKYAVLPQGELVQVFSIPDRVGVALDAEMWPKYSRRRLASNIFTAHSGEWLRIHVVAGCFD
jgi:hypothetical protein